MMATVKKVIHPAGVIGGKELAALRGVQENAVRTSGMEVMRKRCPLDYKARVVAQVDIGAGGVGKGHEEWVGDCMQCYQQALLCVAEGDGRRGQKVVEIIRGWVDGCMSFGGSNAPLEMAWGLTAMVRAAELLKWEWREGWRASGVEAKLVAWVDRVGVPVLMGRYKEIAKWQNNWVLAILEALLQVGLWREDLGRVAWVMEEFRRRMCECVLECGMNLEVRRDQIHSQFGMSSIVQICEMLWHQGVDMYVGVEGRVWRCMEHQAWVLLGGVPEGMKKEDIKDCWFMPGVWDIGWRHFVVRRGLKMPATGALLADPKHQRKRPDMTFCWGPGWTHA